MHLRFVIICISKMAGRRVKRTEVCHIGTLVTYTTQNKLRILNILNVLCSAYMDYGTHGIYVLHKKVRDI